MIMPTYLSKALAILDIERGRQLEFRSMYDKGSPAYREFSRVLRCINKMKKEISHLSDADQLPLGL